MSEARLKALKAQAKSLKELRQPFNALFGDVADYFSSRTGRFTGGDIRTAHQTVYSNKKVLNPRGRLALRTLQNGMQTGITSPARPWFRLVPLQKEMREDGIIKAHLDEAGREIRQLFQRGGVYDMLHSGWADLARYGYDVGLLEDDPERGFHAQALHPGTCWIGANSLGIVDTLYREIGLTVQQMVHKFVYRSDTANQPDWSKVTEKVKRDWNNGNIGAVYPVAQMIMPRHNRDPRSALPKDKPVASIYWQLDQHDRIALETGYDANPLIASRWETESLETYGNSPGMDALPIVKRLQVKERELAEAERRMNRPPINAPAEWRNSAFSFDPESVNFVAEPERGAKPAFLVDPPINEMRQQIRELEQDIDDTMYASLFLMLANLDRRQITAREIDERHEEKLIELGPVLERQHREKLGPLLARAYDKVLDLGLVEPLPEEYDGVQITVDYTSMMAQAQKAISSGGIERMTAYAGNLAAVNGEVLDKIDFDEAVDEYAEAVGVPASMIRSKSAVTKLRKQRQAEEEQAQQMQMAAAGAGVAKDGAQAAKTMAEADAVSPNSPRNILAQLGIG